MGWPADYCFAHDGLFVIPVEHLSRDGTSEEYKELARGRTPLPEGWTALFDEAFRAYWARTAELARKAPAFWFPPRVQHVCVVTDPARVRPYFQPFSRCAWLVHASDLDLGGSNAELLVFQLLQAERMGLMQAVGPALGCNLSYWLTVGEREVELFRDACARTTRPDAEAQRALAEALPWIRGLRHELLAPPAVASAEPVVTVPGTGLLIPRSAAARVERLLSTWKRVVEGVAAAHAASWAARTANHAEELCAWLRDARPRVLVTGRRGRVLWDFERPGELADVRAELAGITAGAKERVRADLELAGLRSQAFVDSLVCPEELPDPSPASADQGGLTYMHLERCEVAYGLREPGMERLSEGAPPYERFLLGARTVHEWGHLAAAAGWVGVPEELRAEHDALRAETAATFDEIVARSPAAVRRASAGALARLPGAGAGPGTALVRLALSRVEDFQSNLLSQRYLTPEERETYVRNNVRSLVHDYGREGFFLRLARYAYELQYLRFSAVQDPLAYFLKVTWFGEQYLRQGIVSEELFGRLVDGLGRICDTYRVDESRFRPVPAPAAVTGR